MPAMWILQAMSGLMLLMVCFTACDLLLARGVRHSRESAVLQALGASRADILRDDTLPQIIFAMLSTPSKPPRLRA